MIKDTSTICCWDTDTICEIRPMTMNDCQAVFDIECIGSPDPWSLKSLNEIFNYPDNLYFVAQMKEQIVGFVGLMCVIDEGDITNITVLPQFRKKHIGNLLIDSAITAAIEKGIVKIHLEVRKSNVAAISLYKKKGFRPIGVRKLYYNNPSEDGDMMELSLGNGGI